MIPQSYSFNGQRWKATLGIVSITIAAASSACGSGDNAPTLEPQPSDASFDSARLYDASTDAESGAPLPDGAGDRRAGDGGPMGSLCDSTLGAILAAFDACCTAADMQQQEYKAIQVLNRAIISVCNDSITASLAKGRIRIDSAQASACATYFQQQLQAGSVCWPHLFEGPPLASGTEPPTLFGNASCSTAVVGLQTAGAPCAQDFECADGLTCVGWTASCNDLSCTSGLDQTDGTCVTAPVAANAACGPSIPPNDGGIVVDVASDYGFGMHTPCPAGQECAGGQCIAAYVGAGSPCYDNSDCMAGLTCFELKCGTQTASSAGGPCVMSSDCVAGNYCNTDDGGGVCDPLQANGSSCHYALLNETDCKGYCEIPAGGTTGMCAAFCGSGP